MKFRVSDTFVVPSLDSHELRQVFAGARTLHATYWDTADMRLARRGHTLRHRTSDDGSEDKWTLKLAGRAGSSLMQRREIDREGPSTSPPRDLIDALVALVGERDVITVARVRTHQDRYRIDDAKGRGLLTLEDDRVDVIERGRVIGSLRVIEIELVDDEHGPRALERATRLLQRAGAGDPDPTSKLAHALGPLAQRESPPALHRHTTVEELIRFAIRDGLDQLLRHDAGVRLDLGPEDVHQARVATRRLRANLRTLRPLLDRRAVDHLRAEIAWAGCLLGRVRDLDVLRVSFDDALASAPLPEGAALVAVVECERATARETLLEAMRTERWQSMLRSLEAAAVLPPLAPTAPPTRETRRAARSLLRRSWRRLERRVGIAHDGTGWHDVRKAAKSTRYAAELFEPVLGSKTRQLARSSEGVQTLIGAQQDRVVAHEWLAGHTSHDRAGITAQALLAQYEDDGTAQPAHWDHVWKRLRRAAETTRS